MRGQPHCHACPLAAEGRRVPGCVQCRRRALVCGRGDDTAQQCPGPPGGWRRPQRADHRPWREASPAGCCSRTAPNLRHGRKTSPRRGPGGSARRLG
eukprot:15355846-Alexandrium_andersonii.AAC.1